LVKVIFLNKEKKRRKTRCVLLWVTVCRVKCDKNIDSIVLRKKTRQIHKIDFYICYWTRF
jgi:hypothetical protein